MGRLLAATFVGGSVSGVLYLASFQIPVVRYLSFCLGLWIWVGAFLSSWIATQGDASPVARKGGLTGLLGGLFGAAIVTAAVAWFVHEDYPNLVQMLVTAKAELIERGDWERMSPSLREAYDHPEMVQRNAVVFAGGLLALQFGVIGFIGGLVGAAWIARPRGRVTRVLAAGA